jgi:hypothetical protein
VREVREEATEIQGDAMTRAAFVLLCLSILAAGAVGLWRAHEGIERVRAEYGMGAR